MSVVKKVQRNADFWREAFTNYAACWMELQRQTKVEDGFWPRERDPWPSNWLDLSVNPIVDIQPAYPDTKFGNVGLSGWMSGAEVTLKDGMIYRWDDYHGGGGWQQKQYGYIFGLGLHWKCAMHARESYERHVRDCERMFVKVGDSYVLPDEKQEELVRTWNYADRRQEDLGRHAFQFFLYWLQT